MEREIARSACGQGPARDQHPDDRPLHRWNTEQRTALCAVCGKAVQAPTVKDLNAWLYVHRNESCDGPLFWPGPLFRPATESPE
jgi:hypothetical protein